MKKTARVYRLSLSLAFLSIILYPVITGAQVINYEGADDNEGNLANALQYDSELNGADMTKADRAKAERYYLAYLENIVDTAQQARVYAQLGALYAVAINPRLGEKPDYDKASMYFKKVLELEPKRVAGPTLRARTMLAGMAKTRRKRFEARMEVYEFIKSIDTQTLEKTWLPSRGKGIPPTDNEIIKLKGLVVAIEETCATNMVAGAARNEVWLSEIVRAFPDTRAANMATKKLGKTDELMQRNQQTIEENVASIPEHEHHQQKDENVVDVEKRVAKKPIAVGEHLEIKKEEVQASSQHSNYLYAIIAGLIFLTMLVIITIWRRNRLRFGRRGLARSHP